MTLQNALAEFMVDQQIRGNSPYTLRHYRACLAPFTAYISPDAVMDTVTLPMLKAYYMRLTERQLSSTTVQTYVRALRAFLTWCYQQEYITVNLSEKFRLPKAQRKVIDVLTDTEVSRLMACFDMRSLVQLRNCCLCSLMMDSGLRMHEVTTLTVDQLHVPEGYAIVNGKGNKQRIVPLGLHTRKVLNRYMSRRPDCAGCGYVFLRSDGQPVTDNTMKQLFKKLKRRSGIPRLRAHLLRHTFATRYLENGGDIYSLQQILGHTSLEMVKRYVHFTPGKTLSNHAKYSPLDNVLRA